MKKNRVVSVCVFSSLVLFLCACNVEQAATSVGSEAPVVSSVETSSLADDEESTQFHLTQTEVVNKTKYEGERDFETFLSRASAWALIPALNEAFIPQGIAYSEENARVYISQYASEQVASVIVALDAASGGMVSEYHLYNPDETPFTCHVGGVACTERYLFVSAKQDNEGGYQIARFPLESVTAEGCTNLTVSDSFSVPVSPSFLNCSNGYLWVGNFYYPRDEYVLQGEMNYTVAASDGEYGCFILGYRLNKIDAEQTDTSEPDCVLLATEKIQGMTFAGTDSVWLSQSYGRKNNSALLKYQVRFG